MAATKIGADPGPTRIPTRTGDLVGGPADLVTTQAVLADPADLAGRVVPADLEITPADPATNPT
jgi:hypothetical protein